MATKPKKNPLMAFRLKKGTRRELDKVSRALGYKVPGDFLRDFIEVTISGDIEQMHTFLGRAAKRAQERLQAQIPGLLDAPLGDRRSRR